MSDAACRYRSRWLRDFAPLVGLMVLIFMLSSRPTPVALGGDTANFAF